MKILYLIRHGQSSGVEKGCYGGIADFPLSENGRLHAKLLPNILSGSKIEIIFSSPLLRALETSQILKDELNIDKDILPLDDLMEWNSYGVLSGVNKHKAAKIFGPIIEHLTMPPEYSDGTILGAENKDAFIFRVKRCFAHILDVMDNKNINVAAIVGHGKYFQFLCQVLGHSEPYDYTSESIYIIKHIDKKINYSKIQLS